jgi:hypothetical protein
VGRIQVQHRAFHLQQFQQCGHSLDFVALVRHRDLTPHLAVGLVPGMNLVDRQRPVRVVERAPQRLAVDGDQAVHRALNPAGSQPISSLRNSGRQQVVPEKV